LRKEKILIYGDIHLSSGGYGRYKNYPKQTLYYYNIIADKAEEIGATCVIGLGDFTSGRFNTLEYRLEVEKILTRFQKATKNKHYMIKGNHDTAPYGMTEYDYYIEKGKIQKAETLIFGKLKLNLINYGEHLEKEILIEKDKYNVVLAHGYFKNNNKKNTNPVVEDAVDLVTFTKWSGVELLISGHIHNYDVFETYIEKAKKPIKVIYPGSLTRPTCKNGEIPKEGKIIVLESDSKNVKIIEISIPLLSSEETFSLSKKKNNNNNLNLYDILDKLNTYKHGGDDPENLILTLEGVDIKYKEKAIELLKNALK